jgi:flagellar L-ring protein precursor FlgH
MTMALRIFPTGLMRAACVVTSLIAVSGCDALTRLSEIGDGPQMTPITNPIVRPSYQPVTMPMPQPISVSRNPNSLWRTGARAFFRDQRASQVGDIVTVTLDIADSAALQNKTTRTRNDKEDGDITALFGLESEFSKVLPQGITPAGTVSLGTQHDTEGDGEIDRGETIAMTLAATITQVLPNGNFVIFGRQEVKVNFEKREVMVTGIVRPEDIDYTNSISHEKIAEMRVAYGGRGMLSDLQQPRYGTQAIDILFPF